MRGCGVDYAVLFKKFALVPIENEVEHQEAAKWMEFLESRTKPSKSQQDYQTVLGMLIARYRESLPVPEEEHVDEISHLLADIEQAADAPPEPLGEVEAILPADSAIGGDVVFSEPMHRGKRKAKGG